MEQERFSAEESEKKQAKRKRRGLDVRGFLEEIGFLEQRGDTPHSEEDDKTEKHGKKKRRKRIGEWLREKKEKFFGPLIPEPMYISDETPETEPTESEEATHNRRSEENPLFAVAKEATDETEAPGESLTGSEDTYEDRTDIQGVIEGLEGQSDKTAPHATPEAGIYEQPVETYELNEDIRDLSPEYNHLYDQQERPVSPYRDAESGSQPETRRVNNKQAVAVSLLLTGAERHARRNADKAMERKYDKELKEVGKELDLAKSRTAELERSNLKERQTPQPLYERPVASEERANTAVEKENYPRPVIPEPYRQESRPEAPKFAPPIPEFIAAKRQENRLAETMHTKTVSEVQALKPETVLKQVEAAAEQDIPIEAVYERRQEIKDEASRQKAFLQTQTQTASIGGGVAAMTATGATNTHREHGRLTAVRLAGQQIARDPLYKRAVVSGVSTALVIVAVMIIIMVAD